MIRTLVDIRDVRAANASAGMCGQHSLRHVA
jgi:hypothetical protein